MTKRSKREIENWAEENLSGGVEAEVDLNNEEAHVIRKWDMIQQRIRSDESLTVDERETLRRVANRTPSA